MMRAERSTAGRVGRLAVAHRFPWRRASRGSHAAARARIKWGRTATKCPAASARAGSSRNSTPRNLETERNFRVEPLAPFALEFRFGARKLARRRLPRRSAQLVDDARHLKPIGGQLAQPADQEGWLRAARAICSRIRAFPLLPSCLKDCRRRPIALLVERLEEYRGQAG